MNLGAVFDPEGRRVLMCRRRKEPYLGLYNLVGGKIEPGETGLEAAQRELWEETGVSREAARLVHFMDLTYYAFDMKLEVYVGQLTALIPVHGEENDLVWMDIHENFFDMTRFAGEGNLGHILEKIRQSGTVRMPGQGA